jgi:hypothetical protein
VEAFTHFTILHNNPLQFGQNTSFTPAPPKGCVGLIYILKGHSVLPLLLRAISSLVFDSSLQTKPKLTEHRASTMTTLEENSWVWIHDEVQLFFIFFFPHTLFAGGEISSCSSFETFSQRRSRHCSH